MNTRIEIRGVTELTTKLGRMQRALMPKLDKTMWQCVYAVLGAAKRNLVGGHPLYRKTGRLMQLNATVEHPSGNIEGKVGTNVYYGPFHEYGKLIWAKGDKPMRFKLRDGRWRTAISVYLPERPWLAPALQSNQARIEKAFDGAIRGAIQENGL